jgi:hypothetical protein
LKKVLNNEKEKEKLNAVLLRKEHSWHHFIMLNKIDFFTTTILWFESSFFEYFTAILISASHFIQGFSIIFEVQQ